MGTQTVRLPLSRTKRSQLTYAKLLQFIDPRSRAPLIAWKSKTLQPGSTIPESDLWPSGAYPRKPLLIEFAGAENPAHGHNRHKSDNTVILWRYEGGAFVELGRVHAPAAMWAPLLEPLVREAMALEAGRPAPPDVDLIRGRIARVLAAELDLVSDGDRVRILTLLHDELLGRIAEWCMPEAAIAHRLEKQYPTN